MADGAPRESKKEGKGTKRRAKRPEDGSADPLGLYSENSAEARDFNRTPRNTGFGLYQSENAPRTRDIRDVFNNYRRQLTNQLRNQSADTATQNYYKGHMEEYFNSVIDKYLNYTDEEIFADLLYYQGTLQQ